MGTNFGFEKVRFVSPVKVGSRICAKSTIASAELKGDTINVTKTMTIEIEARKIPLWSAIRSCSSSPAEQEAAPMNQPTEVDLPAAGNRIVALDAVRGIAALSVVLAHLTAMNQAVYSPRSITSWPEWAMRLTPIHLLWSGPTSVITFFVLSGFVLSVPFLRRAKRHSPSTVQWVSFYPKRLIRLYLPAWGAILLALLIAAATHGRTFSSASIFLFHQIPRPTGGTVLQDALLVGHISNLDAPLWTLGLEILASMLLPLFILVARLQRVPIWLRITAMAIVAALAGGAGHRNIALLATFGLGVLLAALAVDDPAWIHTLGARKWGSLLLISLVLLNASPLIGVVQPGHHIGIFLANLLPCLGAVGMVAAVVFWESCARALSWKPLEWLGSRSFSLYLTHFPVIVAVAYFISPSRLLLLIVVGVAASLLLAELFARIVEQPSHRLSKRAGSVINSWAERRVGGR